MDLTGYRGNPARELAVLRRELAEERARGRDFIAVISHELRTPLAGLIGYCDLFRAGKLGALSPLQERSFAAMARELARLSRLAESLISQALLARGAVQLTLTASDVREIIAAAVDLLKKVPARSARRVEVSDRVFPLLICDRDRVMQIIVNLLDNADKFSPPEKPLLITLQRRGDFGEIIVTDYGAGIAPDAVKRIFGRFVQLEEAQTRSCGGVGLGLAIAGELARLHGGSLTAVSPSAQLKEPGEVGTAFVLRLPL